MRRAVNNLLEELKSKLGGYAVLLQYRYMNLCVKAEPASLLTLSVVDSEGESIDIEQAALVMQINDFQFEVVPKEDELLFPICKAFVNSHPEFKQKVIDAKEEDRLHRDNDEEKHVIITMPEVDKNRHDFLKDSVAALYDECCVQLDKAKGVYTTRLIEMMEGQSPSDIDEAKDALNQAYDQHKDIIKGYRETKEKEIDEAYQRWLTNQEEREQQQQEQDDALGKQAASSFSFDN